MWRMRVKKEARSGVAKESCTPKTSTPPGSEHPCELAQVVHGITPGHVLQDDITVEKGEAFVCEGQMRRGADLIAAVPVAIQRLSLGNHLLRDINADTQPEAPGQGLG